MSKLATIIYTLTFICSLNSAFALAETEQVEALKARIQTRDRTLLHHVEPIFPKQAFADKQSGSVTMSFTINLNGSISDIVVLESIPEGVFDSASVTALKQWQYGEVKESIKDVKTKFDFAP
ncbi:energy transducer TonB [Colwelliaceae bacterium BS250]